MLRELSYSISVSGFLPSCSHGNVLCPFYVPSDHRLMAIAELPQSSGMPVILNRCLPPAAGSGWDLNKGAETSMRSKGPSAEGLSEGHGEGT